MKKIISTLLASCCLTSLIAQEVVVKGPDEKLQLGCICFPSRKAKLFDYLQWKDNVGEISFGYEYEYR